MLNRLNEKQRKNAPATGDTDANALPDVKMEDDEEALLLDAMLSEAELRDARARHALKYIFPRQQKLHNVFESERDPGSVYLFRDYTVREEEIQVGLLFLSSRAVGSCVPSSS